jgi:hypothetical protein
MAKREKKDEKTNNQRNSTQISKAWVALHLIWEKLEYTKGVIRSHESKNSQYNDQAKKEGQPTIYKLLHRKLNIEEHEPH